MKQSAVEWIISKLPMVNDNDPYLSELIEQAKEIEENIQLQIVHKFAFDYTYNYIGEKTIYEWIPEWFKEYKRLEEKFKKK